eukprot:EC722551.1.p1 GENE.EC722551.1~~EC722551.1.p1  ORF type:complete len:125 (+),score=14.06 EC722551.1:163-537(+)
MKLTPEEKLLKAKFEELRKLRTQKTSGSDNARARAVATLKALGGLQKELETAKPVSRTLKQPSLAPLAEERSFDYDFAPDAERKRSPSPPQAPSKRQHGAQAHSTRQQPHQQSHSSSAATAAIR